MHSYNRLKAEELATLAFIEVEGDPIAWRLPHLILVPLVEPLFRYENANSNLLDN